MRRFNPPMSIKRRRNAGETEPEIPQNSQSRNTPSAKRVENVVVKDAVVEESFEELDSDDETPIVGFKRPGSQNEKQRNTTSSKTDSGSTTTGGFTGTRVDMGSASQRQAIIQLAFQKKYFSQRIPRGGSARSLLLNYFPYVELRKRTIPLPSVDEYLVAMESAVMNEDSDSTFRTAFVDDRRAGSSWRESSDVSQMLRLGYEVFQNTVILLVRQNKNTQIIIPGKSTTSYKGRSEYIKNHVWTNSVEFNTVDYSDLPDGSLLPPTDFDMTGSLGTVVEFDGSRMLKGSMRDVVKDGKPVDFTVDLDLTNSLAVAESYLLNSWVVAKAAKARKKLGYKFVMFSVKNVNFDGTMELNYAGYYNALTGVGSATTSNYRPTTEEQRAMSSNGKNVRYNPRRLTNGRSSVNKSRRRRR